MTTQTSHLALRPTDRDYPEHFATYVGKVPDSDIIESLGRQMEEMLGILAELTEAQALYRYAPGKWSIKQVLGHIIDLERVFAYRALRAARGDRSVLTRVDDEGFVSKAEFERRPVTSIASEYEVVRKSSIALFEGLVEEAWDRRGLVEAHEISARAWAWIICGHERHHIDVTRERYEGAWKL